MKISIKNREFKRYCRLMYDENCRERWEVGEPPYKTIEDYVNKTEQFLWAEFERRNERRR